MCHFLISTRCAHLPLLPTAFPVWTTLRLVVIMAFPIFFPRSLFCTELQQTHAQRKTTCSPNRDSCAPLTFLSLVWHCWNSSPSPWKQKQTTQKCCCCCCCSVQRPLREDYVTGWAAVTGGAADDQELTWGRKRVSHVLTTNRLLNAAPTWSCPNGATFHMDPHWADIQQESHSCFIWENSSIKKKQKKHGADACEQLSSTDVCQSNTQRLHTL